MLELGEFIRIHIQEVCKPMFLYNKNKKHAFIRIHIQEVWKPMFICNTNKKHQKERVELMSKIIFDPIFFLFSLDLIPPH
jgi:hypothetical protein